MWLVTACRVRFSSRLMSFFVAQEVVMALNDVSGPEIIEWS